jgi:hypothetical protein
MVSASCFAGDNNVCRHEIEAGYLGDHYVQGVADQQKLIQRFSEKISVEVTRTTLTLTLRLKAGRTKTFSSVPCDGAPQVRFVDYVSSLGTFVLTSHGWENHSVLLVNEATGEVTEMADVSVPFFSPDYRHFVVFGDNYHYSHNQLQLWRYTPTGPTKAWTFEPEDIHFHSAVWKSRTEVSVVFYPDGEDVSGNAPPFSTPKTRAAVGGVVVKFARRAKDG